jgi:hypothetical protein
MTSEKRRAVLFVITLAALLFALAAQSYSDSPVKATIEYQYDEVGNII